MTHLPKISVVVPSYNQGRFLHQCLESILAQDYPGLELIVMDGGSTDDSVDVIRRFEPRLHYWQSRPDGGQSAAINAGVARASGRIVAWLNSDDLYHDGALWAVGRAWVSHPGRGLYIGNGFRLDDATGVRTRHNRRHMALNRRALREGLDYIQQPSAFFDLAEWRAVGGLDETLRYCMDWDLLIRLAQRGPAVLIDEFLSLSREYQDTKTAAGGLQRTLEICSMIRSHTGRDMTIGGSIYLTETMLSDALGGDLSPTFRDRIYAAQLDSRGALASLGALPDGSPDISDPGDVTFLPIADRNAPRAPTATPTQWPRITVVTPSFNQAQFLERTLESVIEQDYPNLEMMVMDGGSTDGSVGIIERFAPCLAYWRSGPDAGPAQAINEGFARATGEILVWLNSDDMFAQGALHAIGAAFAADPDLDLAYGDALYIDAADQPSIVDHGEYKTSQYFGRMQARDQVPAYWTYVHAVPQPATYFRRRLIERSGKLDETYKFIFDFELFFRLMYDSKILKIDRVLAFYRIHASAKTSGWSNFLIELYRFSRAWWPSTESPAFAGTREQYLSAFMDRYWGGAPRGWLFRAHRAVFSLVVTRRLANPEQLLAQRDRRRQAAIETPVASPSPVASSPPPLIGGAARDEAPHPLLRRPARYAVVFCGVFLPRFPGMSGGEIRDFHLVRGLLEFCRVSMVVPHDADGRTDQRDFISPELDELWTPAALAERAPELVDDSSLLGMHAARWRFLDRLRREGWPVVGPRLPRDVEISAAVSRARVAGALGRLIDRGPDFLFVSPQTNAAALLVDKHALSTRFVFATYDVESVRLARLSAKMQGLKAVGGRLETARGRRFENDYVRHFDGVIAVSELDKSIFVKDYGVAPERVAVIDNGVDANYFAFVPRRTGGPLAVMFPASFGYPPNQRAALRLANRIMPLLWKVLPDAQLWLVGQAAGPDILALGADERIFVTGPVASVLPYFERASFMCAPLELGSGTKTKVIEALSAGLPVVCTALAAEGLEVEDGVHAAIRDSDEGMVLEMLRLFGDRPAMESMARAGRALAVAQYSWDSVLPKLEPWLDTLFALPRVYPPWRGPAVAPGVVAVSDPVFRAMRGIGWSGSETVHIWSLGRECELWIKAAPQCRSVRLELSGNPHVDGRRQDLTLWINGVQTRDLPLPADSRTRLELDCGSGGWRPLDVNRITLRLDASASCAGDDRDLGLCLWGLEIV